MQPIFFPRYQGNLEAGAIHSGHFMVSYVHEETDDILDAPLNLGIAGFSASDGNYNRFDKFKIQPSSQNPVAIDSSLSVLLQHMSLAYSGTLTSPKWKHFKGIKVKLKDKIRLNNIIWREWYMQYIKKQKPVVCQFDIPIFEKLHSRPEAVVLEGKYWKRRLQCLTTEYKKWRMFFKLKNLSKNEIDTTIFQLDKSTVGQSTDNLFSDFMDILMPSMSESNLGDDRGSFSSFDSEFFHDLMMDEFPPLPSFIPFSREISQLGLGDIIQPRLLQLQPSFDEINMDVDSLSPLPNYNDFHSNFKYIMMADHNLCSIPNKEYKPLFDNSQTLNFPSNFPQVSGICLPASRHKATPNLLHENLGSLNSPLNLVQKKDKTKLYGNQESDNRFQMKTTTTNFKSVMLNREKTTSSGMLAPREIVGGQNIADSGDEPRRASTGSSPLLHFGKIPKKHVSFVLPAPPNEVSSTSNYSSLKAKTSQQTEPFVCAKSSLKPVTSRSSNSILELLLSNDSWLGENDSNCTSQTTLLANPLKCEALQPVYDMSNYLVDNAKLQPCDDCQLQPPITIGNVLSKQKANEDTMRGSKRTDSGSEKETKRNYHTTAEHQRRCNIKQGFEMLNRIVPDLYKMNGCKINKATTLIKTAECCRKMKSDRERMFELAREAKLEIEQLQEYIRHLQMKLPASGIQSFDSKSARLDQLFDEYVSERSTVNWKFWIFSLITRPWFSAYNAMIGDKPRSEFFKSVFKWLRQCCSLVNLRPGVLKTMTEISRMTSILTDPSKISREAAEAAQTAISTCNSIF